MALHVRLVDFILQPKTHPRHTMGSSLPPPQHQGPGSCRRPQLPFSIHGIGPHDKGPTLGPLSVLDCLFFGAWRRNRTVDTWIFSP